MSLCHLLRIDREILPQQLIKYYSIIVSWTHKRKEKKTCQQKNITLVERKKKTEKYYFHIPIDGIHIPNSRKN